MDKASELTEIDCVCFFETVKAIAISLDGVLDLNNCHWIPKSLISDDSEVWKKGDEGKLVVPEWFAIKEGLV